MGGEKVEVPILMQDATEKVIVALENPKYNYRTVDGIRRETNLPVNIINNILESNDNENIIRHSLLKTPEGENLYASKRKVSGWSDFVSTIRALNNAKYGG